SVDPEGVSGLLGGEGFWVHPEHPRSKVTARPMTQNLEGNIASLQKEAGGRMTRIALMSASRPMIRYLDERLNDILSDRRDARVMECVSRDSGSGPRCSWYCSWLSACGPRASGDRRPPPSPGRPDWSNCTTATFT